MCKVPEKVLKSLVGSESVEGGVKEKGVEDVECLADCLYNFCFPAAKLEGMVRLDLFRVSTTHHPNKIPFRGRVVI